jgi:tetratricopeptide (TPR) repeat protein
MAGVEEIFQNAMAAHQSGRHQEAKSGYRTVLQKQPRNLGATFLSGMLALETGDIPGAERLLAKAVRLDPAFVPAQLNLGNAMVAGGRHDQAVGCFERVLMLDPGNGLASYNLANSLQALGCLTEAADRFRTALAWKQANPKVEPTLSPDDIRWNLALALLQAGDYEEGWRHYEARWGSQQKSLDRGFRQPLWDGTDLAGRTLLIPVEQGYGDVLQFMRYLPLMPSGNGKIVLEIYRDLLPVLPKLGEHIQIVFYGDPLPSFDLQCPFGSLPGVFETRVDRIPGPIPYLSAPADRIAPWRARIDQAAAGARFKVGLVWAGSPALKGDHWRSPRLAPLLDLLPTGGVHFFGLQMGDGRRDLNRRTLPANFTDLGGEIGDFGDTAAILQSLDLLITSCTSPAHLAGGLNRPCWVLLHAAPDWRWLRGRTDSPWYPSVRLFRQERLGDWRPLIRSVRGALETLVAAASGK